MPVLEAQEKQLLVAWGFWESALKKFWEWVRVGRIVSVPGVRILVQ